MKIDITDPMVQRIVQDDRPIALRKRRRSVVDKTPTATEFPSTFAQRKQDPKTPSKSKKKVRFSDPGPEINSTTGLTPALRHSSLGTPFGLVDRIEVSWPKATPSRRRVSLPPVVTTWASDTAVEIQFSPIRQLLTPRLKRQIARKDLSNEINQIEDEKRLIDKQRTELKGLREELIALRRSKTPADTTYIEDSRMNFFPMDSEISLPELVRDSASIPDSQDENSTISTPPELSLQDSIGIFVDPDCQSMNISQRDSTLPSNDTKSTVHQAIQTEAYLDELKVHIAEQTIHLTKARLELERILPGETTLPLTPPANGDCSPLLLAMLKHLQTARTSLQTTKQSLSSMEAQKNNLQGNFNHSLAKLDVARESYVELLKGARAGAEKYAQARQQISTLESEIEQDNKSSEKLRKALDTYRGEVHALESLITRLEEEGKERLEKMKGEMDEAVADLECLVAAETRGRREAEDELDSRALQICVLQGSQSELKAAISEKQAIIRKLEEELHSAKSDREKETGHLNVRIAKLEEELECARNAITTLELEKAELLELSTNKQSKELKTIGQLKDELRRAVRGVEGIVGGWEKEVVEEGDSVRIAGLMTPCVDGGRFRDVAKDTVDGVIQVNRGKSRRSRKVDSAIGLLEEDIMDV